MANPEHVQIIEQDIEVWNAWRRENQDIRMDLRDVKLHGADLSRANLGDADLRDADLRGANLSRANFARADLRGANLSRADLRDADLNGADLRDADLSRANLGAADLMGANLRRADLRDADFNDADLSEVNLTGADLGEAYFGRAILIGATLSGATLVGADLTLANLRDATLGAADLRGAFLSSTDLICADLSGADLSGAAFGETAFGNTNLTAVRGLETCFHEAPSTLDHRTLARSGPLPLAFLRGCGLPDALIDYLPTLLDRRKAAETLRHRENVFIIHGRDEARWRELKDILRSEFRLNPIILFEQPDIGVKTIIEKFEYYALTCSYAIAVFTPDDEVTSGGETYLQARPNVIYELGWFCARLGRSGVMLLLKEGTSVFSDFGGVIQKRFARNISERILEIKHDLVAAGVLDEN